MPALPFIQDTHLAVPDMAPDWTFLESHIEKGNQQYEKGLNEIASNYSAVLNADVTNQGNQVKKAEYLKQFQEGLDKLAGSNLALPQYQADAEKIMAPFWQDSALLTDMSYTKFKKAEISKGSSIQNSKDKDLRDTYSGDSVELMGLQLDNLRTMDRDKVSSSNLDWDTYTADPGIKAVLQKATDSDDFSITHDIRQVDARGNPTGTISRITNGPGSISNYKVYANGIVDEKYNNYFKMLGKLSVERQVSTYKKMGLPREKAIEDIAAPEYKRTLESMDSHITDFDNTISEKSQLLAKVQQKVASQGGKMDQDQKNSIDQLSMEVASYTDSRNRLKENKATLMTDNGKRGFFLQPEASLAQQHRRDMIDGWAYAQANNVSTSIEEDKPYQFQKTLEKGWAELTNTVRHQKIEEAQGWQRIGIDERRATTEEMKLYAEHPELGSIGGGPNKVAPGGVYSGLNPTEITTEDQGDAANAERQRVESSVYSSVYSPNGISGNALYQKATTPADEAKTRAFNDAVDGFSEYMGGRLSGAIETTKGADGKWHSKGGNPKSEGQFWEIAKFLENQTGTKVYSVEGAHRAMMLYATMHQTQLNGAGAKGKAEADKFRQIYNPIKANMDLLQKDADERSANLGAYATGKNAAAYQNIITKRNGKYDFISSDDMAPDFPNVVLKSFEDGKDVPVSSKEFANMYKSKSIRLGQSGEAFLNGKKYQVTNMGNLSIGKNGVMTTMRAYNDWYNDKIVPKYGSSQELADKIKAVQTAALPGTVFHNKANNIYAGRFTYDLDQAKGVGKQNRDRLRELAQVGNYTTMYVQTPGEGGNPEMAPEVTSTVRNLINDANFQKYVGASFNYNLKGHKGQPMAQIQINAEMPEGAPKEYKDLAGKTILIEKSPTAQGTYVNQFPSVRDASFHKLNRGEEVSSDPLVEQNNQCKWRIKPYPSTGVPQSYEITMTKTIFDPKDGKSHTYTDRASAPAGTTDPEKLEQDISGIADMNGSNYFTARDNFRNGLK